MRGGGGRDTFLKNSQRGGGDIFPTLTTLGGGGGYVLIFPEKGFHIATKQYAMKTSLNKKR